MGTTHWVITWSSPRPQPSPSSTCLRTPSCRSNSRSRSSRLSIGPMGLVEEAIWGKEGTPVRVMQPLSCPPPICRHPRYLPLCSVPAAAPRSACPSCLLSLNLQISVVGTTQKLPGPGSQFLEKALDSCPCGDGQRMKLAPSCIPILSESSLTPFSGRQGGPE